MKHFLAILFSLIFSNIIFAQNTYRLGSTTLTSRIVKDSLDIPWEIIWGPGDHIWCTERFGRVSRINPETGEQDVLLEMSADVYERSEAGMLGMVLHPDFDANPHVFIAYTYGPDRNNVFERLVRFDYTGTSLVPADTLIEGIRGNTTHIGSRLLILPDTTLLMSTGDAQVQSLPQDTNSLSGKFLRMNLDGSIPADNPDPSSLVWSIGHRNAQGLFLAPNGHIYSSEHGPSTDDELNIIQADKNYGWPDVEGYCNTASEIAFCNENDVTEPLITWTPTIAPSDIIWYDHPAIPELSGKLLMTVLKEQLLQVLSFNNSGDMVTLQRAYFRNEFGRLRDICASPSGKLYLATNGPSWFNSDPFTHSIIELSNEAYSPTAIDDFEHQTPFVRLSPNPLEKGQTLLVTVTNSPYGLFELYDLSGKLLRKKAISGSENIDINAGSGIYFYRVIDERGMSYSGKLVVE